MQSRKTNLISQNQIKQSSHPMHYRCHRQNVQLTQIMYVESKELLKLANKVLKQVQEESDTSHDIEETLYVNNTESKEASEDGENIGNSTTRKFFSWKNVLLSWQRKMKNCTIKSNSCKKPWKLSMKKWEKRLNKVKTQGSSAKKTKRQGERRQKEVKTQQYGINYFYMSVLKLSINNYFYITINF